MAKNNYHIALLGAGGLGVPAAWGICADWPSQTALELHIYDGEAIERSNLNRQVLFGHEDIGKNKATKLAERLGELNRIVGKNITVIAHDTHLYEKDFLQLSSMNCVLDATDSAESKVRVNDFCVLHGIHYCYGGAVGYGGLVVPVQADASGNSPCLRCLFGGFSESDFESQQARCQTAGILGPVAGYVGFLQAREALNLLWAARDSNYRDHGFLFRFSSENLQAERVEFAASPDCLLGCGVENRVRLDLKDQRCPSTFLYTKLALEQLAPQKVLDVRFNSSETAQSVRRSVEEHGYQSVFSFREAELGHLLLKGER